MEQVVTESLARKVLETVDAGLVSGMGEPKLGGMCVEAAVCFAMGLPHSDRPTCVGEAVRRFKIRLNDANWSSNDARTAGMRKLAIAQLGSNEIDQKAFAKIVVEQVIRQITPIALRAAASRLPKHAEALEAAAVRCEKEGTGASARNARDVARDADADAYAYAYAAADADAYAYAYAAADADAYAYADADADAYAYAAADADAYAYADAYAAADAYADAAAAAYAAAAADADAAAYAYADAYAYAYAARDSVLNKTAEIGLAALIELKSPGCAFLYLAELADAE